MQSFLIELYLPIVRSDGSASREVFDDVRRQLTEKFGGVTAFLRSPASGLWQDPHGEVQRDEIVIFEVIADALDREWWRIYRENLERRLQQESIIIHASAIEML